MLQLYSKSYPEMNFLFVHDQETLRFVLHQKWTVISWGNSECYGAPIKVVEEWHAVETVQRVPPPVVIIDKSGSAT
jgi:hypothetical protein